MNCDFCGRPYTELTTLNVLGRDMNLCENCIALCSEIAYEYEEKLAAGEHAGQVTHSAPTPLNCRRRHRSKRIWTSMSSDRTRRKSRFPSLCTTTTSASTR